MIQTTNITCVI